MNHNNKNKKNGLWNRPSRSLFHTHTRTHAHTHTHQWECGRWLVSCRTNPLRLDESDKFNGDKIQWLFLNIYNRYTIMVNYAAPVIFKKKKFQEQVNWFFFLKYTQIGLNFFYNNQSSPATHWNHSYTGLHLTPFLSVILEKPFSSSVPRPFCTW